MSISRTPKNSENNEDNFQLGPSTAQIFEDVDHENTPKPEEVDDKYEALSKQMAEMQQRLVETERANMALISQPQGNASQVSFVEQDPNKIELPDPALDPNGYDRAVAARNDIRSQNNQRRQEFQARQQSEMNEKVDNLWETFADKFPDMADDKEKIDFVATSIAKDAAKRGIDINRYMFVTQDKFLNDVAAKFIKVFGDPSDNNNEDNEEDTSSRRRNAASPNSRNRSRSRNREEDYDMGRTGGVFGGTESGGKPSRRNRDDDEGPSMIDDIQVLQRKTGFF